MLSTNADRKVLVLWLIAVGLITARELRTPGLPVYGMPRPSAYVGSAIVYGAAAILSEAVPELAVAFAFGWTLAIAYQIVNRKAQTGAAAPRAQGA